MTEAEWLTSEDLAALLRWDHVRRRRRKLRLFSCGCCRQLGRWLKNPRLMDALAGSERYADGLIKDAGLARWALESNRAWDAVREAKGRDKRARLAAHWAVAYTCCANKYGTYQDIAARVLEPHPDRGFGEADRSALGVCFRTLLRCVFGNPFRPVAFAPGWRTEAVVGLARGMYDGRDFAAMPVLADALEEAGCDHPEVLAHCRDPQGVHVRGCWVVDGVLGLA